MTFHLGWNETNGPFHLGWLPEDNIVEPPIIIGDRGPRGQVHIPSNLIPPAREKRLQTVEKKLKAETKRRLFTGLERVEINVDELERLVAEAFEELPRTARKVNLSINQSQIKLPNSSEQLSEGKSNLNLRLLLLLGV